MFSLQMPVELFCTNLDYQINTQVTSCDWAKWQQTCTFGNRLLNNHIVQWSNGALHDANKFGSVDNTAYISYLGSYEYNRTHY